MYLIFFADAICLNCKEDGPEEEGSFPFQDVEKAQGIIMIFYTVQPHFHARTSDKSNMMIIAVGLV
jgi:hypothetical protein